ncbi:hypothetical protein [Agrobacterium tumefaciens]|uniref:hypothetical protein n=1 Tax=Agrobacterium tumefaciens TaxID=358 RepID=UPI001AE1E7AB|nr:hypothetical protein [Agrobacterium tumefaciens]MBP2534094.1 hypothetical protein [Agrobacterium tumefaciens]
MPKQKRSDSDSNWPTLSKRDWYVFAICLAIGAVISTVYAGAWVFGAPAIPEMKQRIDVLAPFGAIYLALMTFCTVAWRGMVTSRQADQQKRQNDANDEANYSKLLQEAAKLIAEKEKIPQVVAGISTLEILMTEPQQRFGIEAMDLLADLLMDTYGKSPLNNVNRATLRALRTGERRGIRSRVDGVFERPVATDSNRNRWTRIPGLRSLSFTGGTMTGDVYESTVKRIHKLNQVRLEGCTINKSPIFSDCTFHACKIDHIHEFDLELNNFYDCDFSGCIVKLDIIASISDMKVNRNYYRLGNPPYDSDGNELDHEFITYDEYSELIDDDIPF